MPLNPTYRVGTVTVSAGGSIVTGAGTQFVAGGIQNGDVFECAGLTVTVESVDSATKLTLVKPWPGSAVSAGKYEVRYTPDASRVMSASRQAISEFAVVVPRVEAAESTASQADVKATSAQRAAGKTPFDYNASGNGSTDDSGAVRAWAQAADSPVTFRMVQQINGLPADVHLNFRGGYLLKDVAVALNMVGASGLSQAVFENGIVDMNRRNLGNVTGHALSLSGHDITVRNMDFRDFGSDGVGGGSGLNVSTPTGDTHSRRLRLFDSKFSADPTAPLSFGYVLSNIECGIISRVYVDNVIGGNAYAHELKNDARYNSMDQLVAANSSVAVGFGQQTDGVDGSDYNVVTNVVGARTDQGILVGEGMGNVFAGGVHDATGSPGISSKRGVQLVGQANKNIVTGWALHGDLQRAVAIEGDANVVDVAAFGTSEVMVLLNAGSKRNVVRFAHTGDRTSILPYIVDNSGSGIVGTDANVFRNDAGGERIGSRLGYFLDAVSLPGASFTNTHPFRYLAETVGVMAIGTTGASGNLIGLSHAVPGNGARASFWNVLGTAEANDRWAMRGFGQGEVFNWNINAFYPSNDASHASAKDLGRSNGRFRDAYVMRIRPGSGTPIWTSGEGSPEGVLSAPVGSLFTRTDGGAGTTLYVKESGTGSAGWTAK